MKKLLSYTFSRLAVGRVLARQQHKPGWERLGFSKRKHEVDVEGVMRHYLIYFIIPLWLVSGILDWYYHRRTHIEKTAGTRESMIHILMMSEIGFPIMIALFIEMNPLVLALMIVGLFLHEATAHWDIAYAANRREVTPSEQHVHSFLDALPLMVVSFTICLYWDQFLSLVGKGRKPTRFELRRRREPLAPNMTSKIVAALTGGVMLPYAEELWRCYRAEREVNETDSD